MNIEDARLLSGHRRPRWQLWLLDAHDQPLRLLDGVRSGSIELSATDRLGGKASLELSADSGDSIDWFQHRVKIIYDPGIRGIEPWPLGIYLFASPVYVDGNPGAWKVDLHSKMLILDQATTMGSWSCEKGRNLVEAAAGLIRSTGEQGLLVAPTMATAAADMVFPAGESLLTVVNKLLQAANYWACYTDGDGQYVLAPYVPPASRPVVYRFSVGEASVHMPGWSRKVDWSNVPNRVECFTADEPDSKPLIGVATNTDPASVFSFQSRGRWITRRERVEAATQEHIDALAQRLLISSMSPLAKRSVTHAMLPINVREAVEFDTGASVTKAVVQKMKTTLDFDAHISAEWNEVS